MHHNILVEM